MEKLSQITESDELHWQTANAAINNIQNTIQITGVTWLFNLKGLSLYPAHLLILDIFLRTHFHRDSVFLFSLWLRFHLLGRNHSQWEHLRFDNSACSGRSVDGINLSLILLLQEHLDSRTMSM